MPKRSATVTAIFGLVALSALAVSLVSVPGVSQAATSHDEKAPTFYLSLGDSYAIGFQPTAISSTDPTGGTPGYTAYVADHEQMTLENFGCGGATTSSIIGTIGCNDPAAFDAVPYPTTTQEQAALDFIAAHPGQVGLITISIGGNDVTGCIQSNPTAAAACLTAADSKITTNVTRSGLVPERRPEFGWGHRQDRRFDLSRCGSWRLGQPGGCRCSSIGRSVGTSFRLADQSHPQERLHVRCAERHLCERDRRPVPSGHFGCRHAPDSDSQEPRSSASFQSQFMRSANSRISAPS